MKSLKKVLLYGLIAFIFSQCNTNSSPERNLPQDSVIEKKDGFSEKSYNVIEKPFKNLDVAYEFFEIDSQKEQILTYKTGTKIVIPANCFVNFKKEIVKGKILIRYREIRTPAEIIASGITMRYDSAGQTYFFQTAGMFELQISKTKNSSKTSMLLLISPLISPAGDDENVFIAEEKPIQVHYVSKKGDFNFYKLDEKKGWQPDTKTQVSLLKTTEKVNESDIEKPLKPVSYNAKEDLIVQFPLNLEKHPEYKIYSGVIWKFEGDKSQHSKVKNLFQKKMGRHNYLKTRQKNGSLFTFVAWQKWRNRNDCHFANSYGKKT